jgi:hypothetical protein
LKKPKKRWRPKSPENSSTRQADGVLLFAGVLLAYFRFARRLPLGAILSAPLYIVWKVPLYLAAFFKPQTAWIRTPRE